MKQVTYETIRQTPKEYLEGVQMLNTLGKVEAEELLSKILNFSLEQNQWVAVSLRELGDLLDADAAPVREARKRQEEYEAKVAERASHCWLRRLFLKRIPVPEREDVPLTALTMYDDAPLEGFKYLQLYGYVETFEDGGERFVKATEKALRAIKKWRQPNLITHPQTTSRRNQCNTHGLTAFSYSQSSHCWNFLDLFINSESIVQTIMKTHNIIHISAQISQLNGCKSNNVLIHGM